MEQHHFIANFDQWIQDKRLLELTVAFPDETLIFQGRMLDFNLADDEITVYDELQNEINKIKLANVESISDDVDHYLDPDYVY